MASRPRSRSASLVSQYASVVVVDARARTYTRVRFNHKFKRRYIDSDNGRVRVPEGEDMLTPAEVEQFRVGSLKFDEHTPEMA